MVERLLRTLLLSVHFEKSASPQRSLLFLGSISYFVRCNLTEGKFGASYFSSEVDIFTGVIVYIYIPMFSHHSCSYSSIFFWSPKKEEQKQGNVKWDETSGNWLRVQKNAALLLLHHPDWFYFQEMSGLFCPNIHTCIFRFGISTRFFLYRVLEMVKWLKKEPHIASISNHSVLHQTLCVGRLRCWRRAWRRRGYDLCGPPQHQGPLHAQSAQAHQLRRTKARDGSPTGSICTIIRSRYHILHKSSAVCISETFWISIYMWDQKSKKW